MSEDFWALVIGVMAMLLILGGLIILVVLT